MIKLKEMLADQPFDDRVSRGRVIEKKILNALRGKGYTINTPTQSQDMHDKIDGIFVGKKGEYPLQVKYRESGDDILFELIKDFGVIDNLKNITDEDLNKLLSGTSTNTIKIGRDMTSKAKLYVVADRNNTVRIYYTDDIKEKAKDVLNQIVSDLKKSVAVLKGRTMWRGPGWEAKITVDRGMNNTHQQNKIVVFFAVDTFTPIETFQNLYK